MRDWFQYFPGNFMWSQGMMIVLEMARWGGASISEVDRVGQKLVDKPGDNDAWAEEWEGLARRIESMGQNAAGGGNYLTAGSHYLRAAVYYFSADRFLQPGLRKRELYESCLRYEVPAGAAYDWLAACPDVDASRIALMAFSMGGYYAPRAASLDHRFAACVAWGGHFDYHGVWVERRKVMEAGGSKVSAPHFQLPWVLGVPDMDEAMKKLENYKLAGVVENMKCPFLVTHGDCDTIAPAQNAHLLYEAVGSVDKTIRIFTAEEGGAEHCQGDNRQLGSNYVADWLASRLNARPPDARYLPG